MPVIGGLLARLAVWSELRTVATRVAELREPNIAPLLGHGVAAGAWPFWVTEHGRTLRDELAAGGAFELARVARIGARCAKALAAAAGGSATRGPGEKPVTRPSSTDSADTLLT